MDSDSPDVAQLRHLLKAIHYRMGGVLDGAPIDFGAYSVGPATRTPLEILTHVSDVLSWAASKLDPNWSRDAATHEWPAQVARYQATLSRLDQALAASSISRETAQRLTQGPLTDVLTHVGQLAMIRGLAGAPIPGQNFFMADIPDVPPHPSSVG